MNAKPKTEADLEPQKARTGETFTMTTMHGGPIKVPVLEPCEIKTGGHWHCITCDKGFATPFEKAGHFDNPECRAVWICHEHGAEQP